MGEKLIWRIEGPFDSSYSLALLNRETARALDKLGHTVILHSTEGPGDFAPNPEFLSSNPDLAIMHSRDLAYEETMVDVTSRNLYPPRVEDMHSRINMLHHFAWEESGFPAKWVDNFNEYLNGITCLSRHVEKIMIDNGVTIPLSVSGCGVDHWERIEQVAEFAISAKSFRFLHVSSCFPRKGADLLLEAFCKAFTAREDVTLVIKTFQNPHNEIHQWVAKMKSIHPDCPHILIIEEDLSDSSLKALYHQCHAFVAPSKAEGFGLPMAEAMLSGLPVITTGWGGQLDFCTEQTAWLVDYEFERSSSHFNLFDSVWARANVDDLAKKMRQVYDMPVCDRQSKADAGRVFLMNKHRWVDAVSKLVNDANSWMDKKTEMKPRIGWISTWDVRCGIASYSAHLLEGFEEVVSVLAAHDIGRTEKDKATCTRCWHMGDDGDDLSALSAEIERQKLDVIFLQFNYGFFNLSRLSNFIKMQKSLGRTILITLHSTIDPIHRPDKRLVDLLEALKLCDRVLVHSLHDLNRLKAIGLVSNVCLFPIGIPDFEPFNKKDTDSVPLIATYGFCLPHKGLLEMVEAIALLRQRKRYVRLRMLNAEYPVAESKELVRTLRLRIKELGIEKLVDFNSEFLSDEKSLSLLSDADLIVYPYNRTMESASAAVKYGLATGRPVAGTNLDIFEDVKEVIWTLSENKPERLASELLEILDQLKQGGETVETIRQKAERWRLEHSYPKLSRRLSGMIIALDRKKNCRII